MARKSAHLSSNSIHANVNIVHCQILVEGKQLAKFVVGEHKNSITAWM
ncbi:MAG: hypothetical protein QOG18_838 [Microbacteriaceae bacterium]|jgi:hypothetical protein|nr:hypothetical protein [Microbacteriaceae bacterium]